MFITSVVLFILGIYVQALYKFSLDLVFFILFVLVTILGFTIVIRYHLLASLTVLLVFFLTGMLRMSFSMIDHEPLRRVPTDDLSVFSAIVLEKTDLNLILSIEDPTELRGIKAIFRGEKVDVDIGDGILILGKIKVMNPSRKNPHLLSWKWIKNLDGVKYEIKGQTIEKKESSNPMARLRRVIKNKIEKLGLKEEGIIKAFAIGDRSSLDHKVRETFLKTGTSHILAISGLHMGIIAACIFHLARWTLGHSYRMRFSGDDRRFAAIISIPVLIFFTMFFGSSPSTVRASIMIGVYLVSIFLEREREIISSLALSCLLILLVSPHSLFTPSFQLSFTSVLFILLVNKSFNSYLQKIKSRFLKWIFTTLVTSQGAIIGTLPVVLFHFHGINPFSAFHNIIAVPILCGVGVPISIAGAFLPYGEILLKVSDFLISYTVTILGFLNYGYIYPFFRPVLVEIIFYYMTIVALFHIRAKVVRFLMIFILVPVILIYSYSEYQKRFGDRLCVNFLDVGVGEAILLEAPGGIRAVIDSGGKQGDFDAGKWIITPILLSKKIFSLDYLFITHAHQDHAGGALTLMENFTIKKLGTTPEMLRSLEGIEIILHARRKGIPVEFLTEGDRIILEEKLSIMVLNPPRDFLFQESNDNSLVLKVSYKNVSFLFTGDITEKAENRLIFSKFSFMADCLKVPHHGSSSSSSHMFVYLTNPKIAIITGGILEEIPLRVIDVYRSMGIPLISTKEYGCVTVCTDGTKMEVRSYE
ncbi:MAG: DNA internalization-related competence protein ComEC/Rec2 [Deltaproteobacteria bacterium]|nr:DNA internalization-related competence protein ComEC/Rec2 [Deltaproteobacteria bacterium]